MTPARSKYELANEFLAGKLAKTGSKYVANKKFNVQGFLADLGLTMRDFVEWVKQNKPEAAATAFPEERLLTKEK